MHAVLLHGIDELQDGRGYAKQYVELDRVECLEVTLGQQGDVTHRHYMRPAQLPAIMVVMLFRAENRLMVNRLAQRSPG